MQQNLRFGVIGTGGIASDFARALSASKRCSVVNVCGSSADKARAFADRYRIPSASASLEEMLRDPNVEAVYVATPHPAHEAQAIACIDAGKHVLCEKPITIDATSAARVLERGKARGVLVMEAFMYRTHPLLKELVARLKAGAIGEIRHVRADFAFRVPRDPKGRLFDKKLGGGGILDVGGYPVSFVRLIAGLVEGTPFAEPTRLQAVGYLGPTGADEIATALLNFRSGLTATVTCGVHHAAGTTTVVFGELGRIVLPDPWIPQSQRHALETSFSIIRDDQPEEVVSVKTELATYAIEAETMADMLPALEPVWPAMSHADTLGNMRVLDAWMAALNTG
jgi:predicted dehydrogenase